MPIIDRREISFDAVAILGVIANSPRVVQALHLPTTNPKGVRFDPDLGEITLLYDGGRQSFCVQLVSLKTLLISYCLRAGIRVPRTMERNARVDMAAVVLVFETSLPFKPAPAADPPRSMAWREPVTAG